jgi:urease accessory protein
LQDVRIAEREGRKAVKAGAHLLTLLHLTDSSFPIGSFAHSDGLEAATQSGAVLDGADLSRWLDVCLDETIGRLEGPVLAKAWTAFRDGSLDRLVILDGELTALRPSSTARRASRAMGLRLLTGWQALYPDPLLGEVFTLAQRGRLGPTLPVSFGVACASADVELEAMALSFAYSRLAATMSAAMRLMSVGQAEAHGLLARTLARVPAVVQANLDTMLSGPEPESFAPAMDLAVMRQQYLHSRMFLS